MRMRYLNEVKVTGFMSLFSLILDVFPFETLFQVSFTVRRQQRYVTDDSEFVFEFLLIWIDEKQMWHMWFRELSADRIAKHWKSYNWNITTDRETIPYHSMMLLMKTMILQGTCNILTIWTWTFESFLKCYEM